MNEYKNNQKLKELKKMGKLKLQRRNRSILNNEWIVKWIQSTNLFVYILDPFHNGFKRSFCQFKKIKQNYPTIDESSCTYNDSSSLMGITNVFSHRPLVWGNLIK